MRARWSRTLPYRLSVGYCIIALYAAAWTFGESNARATAVPQAALAEREGWSLENDRLALRVSQQRDGGVTMTALRDRLTGRAWLEPGSELFRIEGTVDGRPFTFTGRTAWVLLQGARTRELGGDTLHLRLRAVGQPVMVDLRWHVAPGLGPLEFGYTVAAVPRSGRSPHVLISAAETLSLPLLVHGRAPALHWVEKGRPDADGLQKHERTLAAHANQVLLCSSGLDREAEESVPWLAIEDGGEGCYLGWAFSGYGRFEVARRDDRVLIRGGLDPHYFRHWLQRGEALAVPACLLGVYSGRLDDGLGDFHDFLRAHWLPSTGDPLFPRVQYNTWCSLGLNINERKVLQQMEAAHRLGAELFHLDAGWYAQVGDWRADPRRFPHGIKFLSDRAHQLGMKFGLWVAWTQAGPELLRRHPDWLDHSDTRPADYGAENVTSQTLCLGHRPVRAWAKRELARIVREDGLDYLEFDGRMVEACHRGDHTHQEGDGNYAAVQGHYEVLDWLRSRFPRLLIEDCCDGGRMLDYGILRRVHLASVSDLYSPTDNRRATYGATFPFPPQVCESYMEDANRQTRVLFRSSMMGTWSISCDAAHWQPAKIAECRAEIARYKEQIRPLVRTGRVRHLQLPVSPLSLDWTEYALEDPLNGRGALFAFRLPAGRAAEEIPLGRSLSGLQPDAYFLLRWSDEPQAPLRSGASLRDGKVRVTLPQLQRSAIVTWERVGEPATAAAR
jgi:hypothetical protein